MKEIMFYSKIKARLYQESIFVKVKKNIGTLSIAPSYGRHSFSSFGSYTKEIGSNSKRNARL
jgi:hypothetical protein